MRKRNRLKEDDIVERIEKATRTSGEPATSRLLLGIGDDAALWAPQTGFETVLTTDWFLEGTHFWRDWHPAEAVGWKCLMRAASDIAAMGAVPRCFLLSLALPTAFAGEWLDKFLQGLKRASNALSCPLAGGDTTRSDKILINVTIIGEVRRGKALHRSSAKPGDLIYVTGRLGEAELGLRAARNYRRTGKGPKDKLLSKYLHPEARIALGAWLSRTGLATAAMDLSDGLSLDLHRLCKASGVGALIQADHIPLAGREFRAQFRPSEQMQAAIDGGDDYELLFCVMRKNRQRVPESKLGVTLTQIGEIGASRGVSLSDASGHIKELIPRGWNPF